jgi:hypothetical protein
VTNRKGCERNQSWPNFALCCHLPGGTEENYENFSLVSQSPGRDFNPLPPEYEGGVLTAPP